MNNSDAPVALITGAAKRVGAAITEQLHTLGWRVLVHCHHSEADAETDEDESSFSFAGSEDDHPRSDDG